MFNPKYILISLVCAFCFGCNTPENEVSIKGGTSVAGTSAVMVRTAGATQAPSLFVFREYNGSFLLDSGYNSGWDTDGKMALDLEFGDYKFLFAKNFGTTLTLDDDNKDFGMVDFYLASHPIEAGFYASADELYLQDSTSKADSVYNVNTERQTEVSARLTRAVGQVDVVLKRIKDGSQGGYDPDPYGQNDGNVMEMIENIRVEVSGAATSVSINGGGPATGKVLYNIDGYEDENIDDDGFAVLHGPFVIPPQDETVSVDITLTPSISGMEDIEVPIITESIKRNQQLVITLLMNDISVRPKVIVEVDVTDMTDETDGEAGLWD